MFEMFERLLMRLREVWAGMTLNQKVVSGGVLAALLISSLYISTLSEHMLDYTVLFAQLDAKSANEITTRLEQQNIPYRITQGGTAIEVPVQYADRLKIEFTAEGLPESGIVGYEILDTTNFGMSDFLQKVNYKRALEGELSRTLRRLDDVENARVLLVIPEPSLFVEAAQPPTASVFLTLKRGRALSPPTVNAIANLVASAAVEGLKPQDVKIIDSKGNLLSKPAMDEVAMQSSTVMNLKFTYEKVLADKVKQLIDGAFGSGISLVTVNAELDFDRIVRETKFYDQEQGAIVSEQRTEVTNPTSEGGGQEETLTNYEPGVIVENLIRSPGSQVNRLTLSVMLDERETTSVDDEGVMQIEKIPWSEEQIASIQAISETAVGFDSERGDRINIFSSAFSAREIPEVEERVPLRATIIESVKVVTIGIVILAAIGVFFLVVRALIHTLDPSRMRIAVEEEFEKRLPEIPEEEEAVVSEKAELIKKIISKAVKEPEITARTIKSLYRED